MALASAVSINTESNFGAKSSCISAGRELQLEEKLEVLELHPQSSVELKEEGLRRVARICSAQCLISREIHASEREASAAVEAGPVASLGATIRTNMPAIRLPPGSAGFTVPSINCFRSTITRGSNQSLFSCVLLSDTELSELRSFAFPPPFPPPIIHLVVLQ